MSLGGPRPTEFATKIGGDSETFTLRRNRWERHSEKGLGFSIDFPGKPSESRTTQDESSGPITVTSFVVQQEMQRATYTVTVTPQPSRLNAKEAGEALEAAAKTLVADLAKGASASVESNETLSKTPSGVTAARELTIVLRRPQPPDRLTMRVRLYAAGDKVFALIVRGGDEVLKSPDVNRFWNSFRTPAEKPKDFRGKQR
jgi:hypothetical protein